MKKKELIKILDQVKKGLLSPADAAENLSFLPFERIASSRLDTHRELRTGLPEVIFGQNKTDEETIEIAEKLFSIHGRVLATRISKTAGKYLKEKYPMAVYYDKAGIILIERKKRALTGKTVAVISAGTSDGPVADEAALTAMAFGRPVIKIYDAGVAGLHRLLAEDKRIRQAAVKIVVAGMEGALPSVVAGIYGGPVIGVPTSVGYGAAKGGWCALLSMLSSCSPGIAVVNIDNGFGAGAFAAQITGKR